ncbi:hypothetical protein GGF49_000931 [Coemansia sp. RSA 1853]|nr:hypothetical protein GGF49_000931 [Coemansia sp. RSA 1853]
MSLEFGGKRRRADVETAESLAYSDDGALVRSKRMRGADGRLWETALPTPPSAEMALQPQSGYAHHVDGRWALAHDTQQQYNTGMLATPASSPPHSTEPEAEEWEDELDPSSQYYSINRLLNQLHREREQRRRYREPGVSERR